jgi:hypothetical protein
MPAKPIRLAVVMFIVLEMTCATRADDKQKNAKDAYDVFARRCAACHHDDRNGNDDYDVLDWKSLTSVKPSEQVLKKYKAATAYIKSNKPDESLILLRVADKSMPKGKKGPLSAEDQEALIRWVKSGAGQDGFGK